MQSIKKFPTHIKTSMKRFSTFMVMIFALSLPMLSQTAPPSIFYSDLTSGPNSGGENNNGAYVTVYGKRFGASQGPSYIKTGGGTAAAYKIWTDTKVVFQLGGNAKTGSIAVTTSAGTSNSIPFTIRAGNIYFVSNSGNDSSNGSFSSPWRTIVQAKNSVGAGDIAYVLNGVSQTAVDDYNADVSIGSGGTAGSPKALIAYPGATVTIGTTSAQYGLRTPAVSGNKDYWLFAGLNFKGLAAMDLVSVSGWRIVGNDFTCPNGAGQSACVHTDTTTNLAFYGNYVHNVGDAAGSIDKYYHGVYFTTNSNHIDVGWNTVVPNPNGSQTSGGCRAIQFYSTGGSDQFDLHVHDNVIHDAICDGLNFATINPDNGSIEAYNNLIYHVGTGPDPYNGSSNYACITTGGSTSASNPVHIYNNTMYDCGPRGTSDSGALAMSVRVILQNNLVLLTGSESYFEPSFKTSCSVVSGSNNLWSGASSATSCTSADKNSNPQLVNVSGKDFHLQASSPGKDGGVSISTLKTDLDGIQRPQGNAYDIGAYEYNQGAASSPSTCDLNSDGVVDSKDVQIAIAQALGSSPCGSADLQQNGTCNAVDVQRVINSALGQSCRAGQ